MIEWWKAGLFCKCPHCGKGELFEKILKFRDNCQNCGASFQDADAGDGPAVFVILIAGALLVPIMLVLIMGLKLSPLITMLIMTPLTIGLCIFLLRPFKATLYVLQKHSKAKEAKSRDYDKI